MSKKLILEIPGKDGNIQLLKLIYPMLLQYILTNLLSSVHTIALTTVSDEAVAAVGINGTLISFLLNFLLLASLGSTVLMSYAYGRNDNNEASRVFSASITLALVLSVTLGVVVAIFAPQIITLLFTVEGITYEYAILYLRVRALTIVFHALNTCVMAALRCIGNTFSVMLSGITISAVSVLLCVLTVNDILPFENKVLGVALSGVIAEVIGLLISIISINGKVKFVHDFSFSNMKNIFSIGFPATCGTMFYTFAITVTTGIISQLGTDAVNTRIFINNITVYTPVFSTALSSATSVMLGRLFGRKEIENGKRLVRQNFYMALVVNMLIAVIVFVFSRPLLELFTDNNAIITFAQKLLIIDFFIQFGRVYNVIYGNAALVTAKDIKFTSILGISSSWIISVGGCWLMVSVFKTGLIGFYIALATDELFRAVCHYVRWKSEVWRRKI